MSCWLVLLVCVVFWGKPLGPFPFCHGITEWVVLGRDTFHQTRLLKAPSNMTLNTSREGAATSLGNLCQCLTMLIVKNLFPISKLKLYSFSLKLLPFVLFLQALVKSLFPTFLQAPFKN